MTILIFQLAQDGKSFSINKVKNGKEEFTSLEDMPFEIKQLISRQKNYNNVYDYVLAAITTVRDVNANPNNKNSIVIEHENTNRQNLHALRNRVFKSSHENHSCDYIDMIKFVEKEKTKAEKNEKKVSYSTALLEPNTPHKNTFTLFSRGAKEKRNLPQPAPLTKGETMPEITNPMPASTIRPWVRK